MRQLLNYLSRDTGSTLQCVAIDSACIEYQLVADCFEEDFDGSDVLLLQAHLLQ
jgi:hypothetical protein